MKRFLKRQKGFTLVELMVSVAIFAFMTAFLLAKYGNFNQSVLLTNLAYDVALTIRNAQSYGLNVKSTARDTNIFGPAYGVSFDSSASGNDKMIFFADTYPSTPNGVYDATRDTLISTYTLKRNSIISSICIGQSNSACSNVNNLVTAVNISFKRPDPDAIFKAYVNGSFQDTDDSGGKITYAEITLKGTDGSTRGVAVRSTGQISVIQK